MPHNQTKDINKKSKLCHKRITVVVRMRNTEVNLGEQNQTTENENKMTLEIFIIRCVGL